MTKIQFELDGKQVEAINGETVWQVAKRQGREIPHLCYSPEPDYRPDGNCRACMVEVEGERVLAASCKRTPSVGMKVRSASPRAIAAQKMVMELLVADQPARETSHDPDSKFWHWAEKVEVTESRFPAAERWHSDASHPAMSVNLDACIQCGLCVRACREVQVNDVIGMAYRNHDSKIVFDFDDPMGESTCVACGECVQACPTGALMPSVMLDENQTRVTYADRKVDSLCPFCGVGCQVTYQVKDEKVIYAEGRDGPANHNRLCVKGRFGFDYIHHPHRLTRPLVRLPNAKKDSNDQVDPANPFTHFREASWEEALDIAAKGLVKIRDEKGVKALAGFGRDGRRSHHRDWRQSDHQPSGGRDLHQECSQTRRQADRDGPARPVALSPCLQAPGVQGRQRRRDAECDDQHHHHRRPHRRTIYRRLYRGF